MRLLLDTHVFLWWEAEPEKLSQDAYAACCRAENVLMLSTASLWEMQIKVQLGKLHLQRSIREMVRDQEHRNSLVILPIFAEHVYALESLPHHHKDPFDRLLTAQSQAEGCAIVTADSMFSRYGATTLW